MKNSNVLVFGAGAVGATLAAWLHESGQNVSLFVREHRAAEFEQSGIRLARKNGTVVVRPNIIHSLENSLQSGQSFDVIILTVKTYQLEQACEYIAANIEAHDLQRVTVLGLQNGVSNQAVLPNYFPRYAYGVVFYNVWETDAGWRIQKNGPLVIGTRKQSEAQLMQLQEILAPALPCEVTECLDDIVHDKLVTNLVNSITTVIGNTQNDPRGLSALQAVLSNITAEALKTIRMSGYKRSPYSALPPDALIKMAPHLPAVLSRSIVRNKLALIGQTSMTKDVLGVQGETELDAINGYLLALAKSNNVSVPLSERLYDVCAARFAEPSFKPMTAQALKQAVFA